MELLERYLHEVGRYLPAKNRADIQAELRSLLGDALENEAGAEPGEAAVKAVLKKFGAPRDVAAKYYPEGQYLIGPRLYPLFSMIIWIVIAAVCGAQVLALAVGYVMAGVAVNPFEAAAGLVSSIPAAVGWVVVVFYILQRFDVRPDEDEEWNPESLPQISEEAEVKRGEVIFGIVIETFILALLTLFPERIGGYFFPGGTFFGNPVLSQYIGLVSVSLLASIFMDIYMVWQGRWSKVNRVVKLAVNIFSIVVLGLLVQGHTVWLQAHGVTSFVEAMDIFSEDVLANGQIVTMWAFWMGFTVALIVTAIETAVSVFRLVRSSVDPGTPVKVIKLG